MSILSTGTSGLLAFQRALATTSHNVTNSTKEGYSRQRVEMGSPSPLFIGAGYIGQGVQVANVRRIQDEFVDTQLRTQISRASNGEASANFAERIDRLLGDNDTGLAPALGTFFDAANDVSSDPTSTVARTVFLSEGRSMVSRFNELNERIEEQRELLNDMIKRNVDDINSLAEGLVAVNQRIVEGYGLTGGTSGAPNDLLDERGHLLDMLAEKTEIRTLEQEDGALNVFIGNGQPLVIGTTANELVAESLSGDIRNWDIGFATGKGRQPVDITRFMNGGELGGLLESRGKILDEAQNGIGQVAVVMSTLMNRQNNLGLDLNGNTGDVIFEIPEVGVGADKYNISTGSPTVNFTGDVFDLTASDYRLGYDGTNFNLTRLDDNRVVASDIPGVPLIADGIEIDTSGMPTPGANDNWLIQPTRFGAQNIDMLMADPDKVAVAAGALTGPDNSGNAQMLSLTVPTPGPNTEMPAAVVYDAAGGGTFTAYSPTDNAANNGNATIEAFSVSASASVAPSGITFRENFNATAVNDGIDGFQLDTGVFVPLDPSGTTTIAANGWELKVSGTPADGDTFDVLASAPQGRVAPPGSSAVTYNGWTLEILGEPADGDVFSVELSKDRPGDNRNMLAMASLADERVIESSATFAESYNKTLGDIGTRTRQAQVFRDSSIAMRENAQAERDGVSGVNLDEEAANLLKYQKAYQAAAQVISVGNTIFDTLLAAFR
ncbi:Flagellar hook-associated protein 1 [Thiorhodovibrio winogradskyi]|uniref:Flagellar hook-associated protein 1 n=1 Tax=Thiorhodovibrio winogradskyi TaxID=77007 RepID=A0ABZ0SFX6_9GAMM|nr:flagellar hook-associated protein FlgK [Thiorhodovibrio winogradskyi]